jgi:hypothetical protein
MPALATLGIDVTFSGKVERVEEKRGMTVPISNGV